MHLKSININKGKNTSVMPWGLRGVPTANGRSIFTGYRDSYTF
jgi:hypothetical protein